MTACPKYKLSFPSEIPSTVGRKAKANNHAINEPAFYPTRQNSSAAKPLTYQVRPNRQTVNQL